MESPVFYAFSDNIMYAKKILCDINNVNYIEDTLSDLEDFELLKLAPNIIISNSTFSWWSAWLNQNENKTVIATREWFNNDSNNKLALFPQDWILI